MDSSNPDLLRILIATDMHVGFMDKDPIRGNDSLVTLEEILKTAVEHDVDFVLMGGDLFHDNKPSRRILFKTAELMREYCLGDRECFFEIVSDQSKNFPTNRFGRANYLDPNYNISMPIFSIHGNHDDPSGEGNLCAVDLLSVTNFINYFGKSNTIEDITVSPVLITKGNTKLALYGLGSIRDERLVRTFRNNKVKMLRPAEEPETWFNVFVLHQNRAAHGPDSYVKEEFLPDFLNLIIWGHEHECLIDPKEHATKGFFISQPGSSIATSLSDGEAAPKQIGILEVMLREGQKVPVFRMRPIPLKTVRPFVLDEITLQDQDELQDGATSDAVRAVLEEKVNELIQRAHKEYKERLGPDAADPPPLPLVRLKVENTGGFVPFNIPRFGQTFVNRVANPNDILLFYRRKTYHKPSEHQKQQIEEDEAQEAFMRSATMSDTARVEDLLKKAIEKDEFKLKLLSEKSLTEALTTFVEKDEKDAISEFIDWSLKRTRKILQQKYTERQRLQQGEAEDDLEDEIERHKADEQEAASRPKEQRQRAPSPVARERAGSDFSAGSDMEDPAPAPAARGRGRGAARGGRGRGAQAGGRGAAAAARAPAGGRKRQAVVRSASEDGSEEEAPRPPPKKRGASNAPKAAPRGRQSTLSFASQARSQAPPSSAVSQASNRPDSDDEEPVNLFQRANAQPAAAPAPRRTIPRSLK